MVVGDGLADVEGWSGRSPDAPDSSLWTQHQSSESRLTDGLHGTPWSPGHPDVFAKFALNLAHLSLISPYRKNILPSSARDQDPNLSVPGYLPCDLTILSRSLCLFRYPYAYSFHPYAYSFHPYVLLNLPFASLPFPTIFSYQLICLAGTAVPSHRDFPGIGS